VPPGKCRGLYNAVLQTIAKSMVRDSRIDIDVFKISSETGRAQAGALKSFEWGIHK